MTDFLSSLVERSFGTAAAIRPRIGSLFEPARDPAVSVADQPERQGGSFSDDAPETGPSALLTGPRAESTSAERAGRRLESPVTTTAAPAALSIPRSGFPVPRDVADALSQPQPARGSMVQESIAEARVDHRRVPTTRSGEQHDVTRPTAPAVPVSKDAIPGVEISAESVAFVATPRVDEIGSRGLLIPSRLDIEIAADLQSSAAAWNPKPRERAGHSQAATVGKTVEPERNVHVTIGRIEVRATNVEKAGAREPSASPVMSLDEYLRRQMQRGGR